MPNLSPTPHTASCTIQVYADQSWQTMANIECQHPEHGHHAATHTGYELDYALRHFERSDAAGLSHAWPVGIDSRKCPTWPSFLIDLLPQGFGRLELLKHLDLPAYPAEHVDWPLLMASAGNPIGHLRILEAAQTLHSRTAHAQLGGFSRQQLTQHSAEFLTTLSQYGLFMTGSSGGYGKWPKLLLTESHDGLYYLDHTLPDAQAKQHWLVKFAPQSPSTDDPLQQIFRHKAAYMRLADFLGLRVHGPLQHDGDALFIPRFDRSISSHGVERHAQESLAVLNNHSDSDAPLLHNDICRSLVIACSDPFTEIIEYLKRDIANIALGNPDNHSRNSAITRSWDGEIRLTPLFDFAPMYLHPDGISRITRWAGDDGAAPRWQSVLQQIEAATGIKQHLLQHTLREWLPTLQQLEPRMRHEQISPDIISRCHPRIIDICQQIEDMPHG